MRLAAASGAGRAGAADGRGGADVVRTGAASPTCRCPAVRAAAPAPTPIYVQMPDTLALERQQPGAGGRRLRRHGARDQPEELGRHADAGPGARASSCRRTRPPRSARPACWVRSTSSWPRRQTRRRQLLKDGDTIPLKNSSAYPTTEQTLASLAVILRGGGIPNLEVIQNEVYNILNGRADQIREFLGKLDTFTAELNQQRDDITHAIDSTNRLLAYRRQPHRTSWTGCSPNSRR